MGFLAVLILLTESPSLYAADGLEALLREDKDPGHLLDDLKLNKDELNQFYATRHYSPAWGFRGENNAKSFDDFLTSLAAVIDYHGLETADYPIPLMRQLIAANDDASKLKLELLVTDTVMKLAHALHGDTYKIPSDYIGWDFKRAEADIPLTLANAVASNGLPRFIDDLSPHNPAYTSLTHILHAYRIMALHGEWKPIPKGPTLRPKDHGPRVVALRQRLRAENYLTADQSIDETYDDALAKAVTLWQSRNGLDPDGHVGTQTLQNLNESLNRRLTRIKANMERWRHMPDDFPPSRFISINIAAATVELHEDGKVLYTGPVVVGRSDRKTPFIQSIIRSMIINPPWHVPLKIAQKDILPKLRKDPHYLEKMGITIRGNDNDPYGDKINWKTMTEKQFKYRLRQDPGDQNSLGQLKFDFNNDFSVYMHGTPHQELFDKSQRNFSSGCIRLRDPEDVAVLLLTANGKKWTAPYIDQQIANNRTRWVGLKNPIPIFVLYWSVFADETGATHFRPDVYGYDNLFPDL